MPDQHRSTPTAAVLNKPMFAGHKAHRTHMGHTSSGSYVSAYLPRPQEVCHLNDEIERLQ